MRKILNYKILLTAIFLGAFLLMLFTAKLNTQTTDEAIHLVAGYTYLTKSDIRLDPEHPPLLKELGALPLLFMENIKFYMDDNWHKAGDFYYDAWQEARILGEQFLYQYGNNPGQLLFWGRLMTIVLSLILGAFVYFWVNKLYGLRAGILAAFLTLFFPNIFAHGTLINTDLGLTLFFIVAIYFWGEYLKKLNLQNIIFSGLFLGLALVSKYTAVVLVLIIFMLMLIRLIQVQKDFFKIVVGYFGTVLIAYIIIILTYSIVDHSVSILLPAEYIKGLFLVVNHGLGGHSSYLLGMHSTTGWWYYFPVAIFYKTPIPIFILLLLTILYYKKIKTKDVFDECLLIMPVIIFLSISMYSKANLGIRHVLPIFPFLFIFVAKTINLVDFKKLNWYVVSFSVLILWYLTSALTSFPNYIAYFNEFAGGSNNGHKILTDSNLDWGQDMLSIKNYLDKKNIKKPYLVYPWNGDSALYYYNIDFIPLEPEDKNAKGPLIIAATYYETQAYSWLHKYSYEQIAPGVFFVDIK